MSFHKKRAFLKLELKLVSPICISNGLNINTDIDVIRDFNGKPFIPGSSTAGAMRDYLKYKENIQNDLFGYSKMDKEATISKISNLIVYDSFFNNKINLDTRDGVRLDNNKIAEDKQKYNWEIISPKSKFFLRLELNINETMDENKLISALRSIVTGIDRGLIRFGYKKNRGFGKCKVCNVYYKEFAKDKTKKYNEKSNWNDLNSWMQFDWDNMEKDKKENWINEELLEDYYKTLTIALKLKGGISIRRYSSSMEKPDFEHITNIATEKNVKNTPIIPGTSWAGAIRHRCRSILEELKVEDKIINKMLHCIFGFVEDKIAVSSLITVDESVLVNSSALIIRRTKIDSFTSSAFSGKLFDELSYFKGNTKLVVNIKDLAGCEQRCECKNICNGKWILGLLILVKEDIENGYLPIGGQTSIGRGIFEKDGEETIGVEQKEIYFKALFDYISQEERRYCNYGN